VAIQHKLLEVETELIRDGLETAEAVAFVNSMPTVDQLLPSVAVGELEPVRHRSGGGRDSDEWRGRYDSWQPPQDAAGTLLSPSSATNREQKRQAIARALAANPTASDREIARMAGVDHKTVAAARPRHGEIPTEAGEIPATEEDSGEGGAS
jgi:hypothetical protein